MARSAGSDAPAAPEAASQTKAARTRGPVNHWVVPLTLALAILYLLTASTMEMAARSSVPMVQDAAGITFADGTPYEGALDGITSLGLRLFNPCVELMVRYGVNDFNLSDPQLDSQEAHYERSPDLTVATTAITPSDWIARLSALPDVRQVTQPIIANCPAIPSRPNLAGQLLEAPPLARPATLHFIFSVPYGDALRVAAERGLRLADPCYAAAVAEGKYPTWHSESQQGAFTSSSTLIVAPTILTPRDWLFNLPSGVIPGPVLALCFGT